ncbi:cyclin-dependent kinase 15 [Ciconia boyciana]|uniref:cyclin-dependent kinase 15 n=1 Tax=Ciconia boyciana TaxID=52775 RepID=UPI003BA2DA52
MGDMLCVSAVRPGCCSCCIERRGSQHIQGLQHTEAVSTAELSDGTRAPLPLPSLQPLRLHTLQSWRCRTQRPWSYPDPFQEQDVVERLKWQRQGIPFGAATSYVHLEKLCEGSCATVYKGISRINGQLVALKVIRLEAEEGMPFTAIWEASLLKRLKHANIILLHDIIQTKETLTFVFEYMHTNLAQYVDQHPGGLHSCNVMLFMFQLLRVLAYIHQQHILHHDLKPQNLLISCLGELKLGDFGLPRAKSIPRQMYSSEVVTLWYRPPDVLLGATDYSSDLDIWSAGCIFVEMIQGQPIFAGTSGTCEQLVKIWAVLGIPTEDTWPGLSKLPNYNPELVASRRPQRLRVICDRLSRVPAAEDLASRMLTAFPRGRISVQDALLHGFFSPLPPQLYQVPAGQSVLTVPGVRLQPEICDLFVSYQKGHLSGGSSKFW